MTDRTDASSIRGSSRPTPEPRSGRTGASHAGRRHAGAGASRGTGGSGSPASLEPRAMRTRHPAGSRPRSASTSPGPLRRPVEKTLRSITGGFLRARTHRIRQSRPVRELLHGRCRSVPRPVPAAGAERGPAGPRSSGARRDVRDGHCRRRRKRGGCSRARADRPVLPALPGPLPPVILVPAPGCPSATPRQGADDRPRAAGHLRPVSAAPVPGWACPQFKASCPAWS